MVEDDDHVYRSISSAILEQIREIGAVDRAATVAEYLALHNAKKYDVVILDIRLKDARGAVDADDDGGLIVSKALATWNPGALVIVYSAYIDVPQAVLAMRNGAWDCIAKAPKARKVLLESVRAGLKEQAFNDAWFERNEQALYAEYANTYVGVVNGQVVDSDQSEQVLMDRMIKLYSEADCRCYFVFKS